MATYYSSAILQHVFKCKKCGSQLIMDGCGNPSCENYPYRRPTTGAVDLGDSSALEVDSTPEVLSSGQGESTPAPNH